MDSWGVQHMSSFSNLCGTLPPHPGFRTRPFTQITYRSDALLCLAYLPCLCYYQYPGTVETSSRAKTVEPAHCAPDSEDLTPSETEIAEELVSLLLPSRGSRNHYRGDCKQCVFFSRGKCKAGKSCEFCHYPHKKVRPSKKKRDRLKKSACIKPIDSWTDDPSSHLSHRGKGGSSACSRGCHCCSPVSTRYK